MNKILNFGIYSFRSAKRTLTGIVAMLLITSFGVDAIGSGNDSLLINIDYISATVYGNYVMVFGHVSDAGGPVQGDTVTIMGDVNGTATVGPTGNFAVSIPLNGPYGSFSAQASDGTFVSSVKYADFSS